MIADEIAKEIEDQDFAAVDKKIDERVAKQLEIPADLAEPEPQENPVEEETPEEDDEEADEEEKKQGDSDNSDKLD